MQKVIDGMMASSYKLGLEVMIQDKIYKAITEDDEVVWQEVIKNTDATDEVLDKFKPEEFTFFIIGNEVNCVPCANAIKDIERFAEVSDEDITYKKWEYDMDTRLPIGDLKQAWVRRAKQNNEKYRNYNTIPQIWHKGEFMGGARELRQLLTDVHMGANV
jgi:hypothetical protein